MLFADLCRFHLLCSRVKDWINHIFVQFSTCLRMKWSVVYGSSTSFCDKDVLRCIYRDTCDTWGFGKENAKSITPLLTWFGRAFSGSAIRGKYSAGFGKKAQFLDGIRDLTATQEMRFAKSLAWDAVLGKKTIFEVACSAGVFFGRALKGRYFYSPQSSSVIKWKMAASTVRT